MTTAVAGSPTLATLATADMVERRKLRPIVGWAVLGVAFLAFEIYLLASWILSGEAVQQGTGVTPVPTYVKVSLTAMQVICPIMFILALWYLVIRPWRREGHVTTDGLFALAMGLLFWQDPIGDFIGPWAIYNTYPLNFGSWLGRVPGIPFPHAERFAEPILITPPVYLGGIFLMVVVANALMRRADMRWPTLSRFRLIAGTFVFFIIADILIEFFCMAIQYYTFPGTMKFMAVFGDSYFRFPIYEAVAMAVLWTALSCLRYFKNDKGDTYAERGSEQLRATGWRKSGIRFLALIGIVNLIYVFSYNVPVAYFALNMEKFPKAITSKSYLMGGDVLCGRGTTYKCPGPKVPIPRGNSAHVGPDGKLVPAGDGQNTTTVEGSR